MLEKGRFILPVAASVMLLAACGGFGKVNQGRVIDYDAATGLVTLISEAERKNVRLMKYDVLPPLTIQVPDHPKQMGPIPRAGKLMDLDTSNRTVVIFDNTTQAFKSVEYTLVEQRENVYTDDPALRGAGLPKIDRAGRTITLYSPERRQLVKFSVPDEYFELPPDTWERGDEVRYYYKDPHKALRLMNVSKTVIQ